MSKKIKYEENHNTSDDDSSECRSDESMHMTHNEDDTDTETEENNTDTCTIDDMPKLIVRDNNTDADLEDSDDGMPTSEGIMTKLLIRKEHVDDNDFEKDQK